MTPKKPSRDAQPAPGAGDNMQHEYGHSSGDRNTRTDEHDWKHFKDGKERTVHVDTPSRDERDSHHRP